MLAERHIIGRQTQGFAQRRKWIVIGHSRSGKSER
jgi:hypothetical protein